VLTEAELERILPALLRAAPVSIGVIDREHRLQYVNRLAHGYDRSAVVGQPLGGLLPAADRARIIERLEGVFRSGEPAAYETFVETPSGRVLYFSRMGAVRVDGEVRYVVLTSLDITEEHQKRELVERERAMFEALERVNRIILSPLAGDSVLDRLLCEMVTLFGCVRAFLAHPLEDGRLELVHEHSAQQAPLEGRTVELDRRSMLLTRVPSTDDVPWILGIQHANEAVHDAQLPLLAAIAARVADALQTWTAQQAMQQSEQRFRLLVEHAPEAIMILDMDTGRFVEVNSKAIQLFGHSREALLGMGPIELSPALQADGTPSAERMLPLVAAALGGASPVFEWLHQHASGGLLECEVRLLHLPHPAQRWVRGSIINIADRKRVARENERLSSQLAQAQKMQAIGQLTGGIAHDFNNLLTVISGGLEMMQLEPDAGPELRGYATLALEACQRAAALTQRLLAFSRQQPLRPRAVDIAQLLAGMEGLLRRTLGEMVNIEVVCREGLWTCEVDPTQLENAILNLSINARDAMPGGGHLIIEADNVTVDERALPPGDELTAGDYLVLCVSDDGTGIEPQLLGKVFDPFFTTKEVGKGSGLGLSMVYGFAKQSRGHVKVYSELGHGTTVKLFLPRSQRATEPEAETAPRAAAPRGKHELVLVVEDDPSLRALAVELLERLGYRSLAASDGPSALALLLETPDVDLLLADMVLPNGMNGAELARRAQSMRPKLPVLFMSGYTENAIIHNGKLDEGVRLLEKPFTLNALAVALQQALAQ
jgi:PAS domain S-box-containing protein